MIADGVTMEGLRRIWAILLLAVFSFSLMAPAFASDPDSNLPACCRREGKHHCSLGSLGSSSGPGFQATARCPLYGGMAMAPGGAGSVWNPARTELDAPAPTQFFVWSAACDFFRSLSAGGTGERGPPSSSLCV